MNAEKATLWSALALERSDAGISSVKLKWPKQVKCSIYSFPLARLGSNLLKTGEMFNMFNPEEKFWKWFSMEGSPQD